MSLEFQSLTHFEASPERIFAVMTDLDAAAEWMPNIVSIERLDGDGFGVGTQWRETRKMFGKEATELFEVKHCDAARALDIYVDGRKGSSKKGEYHFRYRLEPRDNGTDLQLSATIHVEGWFAQLLGRLFIGNFRKTCEKDILAMKAYIETQAPR